MKKDGLLSHVSLSMDELNLTMDDSREAYYEQVLSLFERVLAERVAACSKNTLLHGLTHTDSSR